MTKTNVNPPINIRPVRGASEARLCAAFIAGSEPWLTLRFGEEEMFRRLTDPSRDVHVAERENQIVGALILYLAGPLNGYVGTVAIHPAWQNRGFGGELMRFAEDRIFRQSPNVFLFVSSFNHRAQEFYKRIGYERIGEVKDFVVRGHSEILMRKTKGPLMDFVPNKLVDPTKLKSEFPAS